MNQKAALVIVTYNRLELLKECINCALEQTRKYDQIIVIDNASTDGTKEYLDDINNVYTYHMKRNTGGAGGFTQGIKVAYDRDFEWITVIDDDAMLDKDYLKNLLEWQSVNQNEKALCGQVKTKGQITLAFARRIKVCERIHRIYEESVQASEYNKEYFYCDEASFCGLTIHRDLIKKIGFPSENFFINYDDTEYSLRIRRYNNIVLIPKSIINHKANSAPDSTWKKYYATRNEIYTVKKHFGVRCAYILTREKIKQANQYIRMTPNNKKKAKLIRRGIIDAWIGRMGKRRGLP